MAPVKSSPFSVQVGTSADLPLGAITAEVATPEQLGLYVQVTGTLSYQAVAAVRSRPASGGAWQAAHPLLRIRPEWADAGAPQAPLEAFAGTIFNLAPGTSYEVEVTVTEPGKGNETLTATLSTRALPAASGPATVTATPSDDLKAKLAALGPGSVLELENGTYNVSGLQIGVSGTASQPIVIRGESREGVVISDAGGTVLQFLQASHVIVERLTLEGAKVDSGTSASSVGVSFWDGASQEFITFRDLAIRGVDMGIVAWASVKSILVYDCRLAGNNQWTKAFVESNLTWNDDGIRLPGQGNCAFNNTLHGFGDSFAVADGIFSAAVYYYRNLVAMTGDDAFEADYATRNIGFYDNHITNSATFLSLDPLWAGPLYCFRNISINTIRGPFKLNNTNCGFLVYNNTIVRTAGTTDGWAWVQFNNGELREWSFRNNVLICQTGTKLIAVESGVCDPIDFSHNAWYPDGAVWWSSSGGSFDSLDAARSGLPATTPVFGSSTKRHEQDLIAPANPFAAPVVLGSDHLTEVTKLNVPGLAASSSLKASGVPIAGITDGFTGSAPNRGALIDGRPVPQWGARTA